MGHGSNINDVAGGITRIDEPFGEGVLGELPDALRKKATAHLTGIEVSTSFRAGLIRPSLFERLPLDRVGNWVWALSGGGARGAFQFGAMLCLSSDVRFRPMGIASTSVGSINLVGAAEGTMQGFEKLRRSWLEVQNLHDMFTLSPWVDRVDRIEAVAKRLSIRDLVEGSKPRSLHPHPETINTNPIDDALRNIINDLPSKFEQVVNALLFGIPGMFAVDNIEEELQQLRQANQIIRDEADGLWRYATFRERILMNLDLEAIRQSGTHLRIVMVSLNDTLTHSVDEALRIRRYSTDRISGEWRPGPAQALVASLDYDGRLLPATESVLLAQAILASASIPIFSPPIRLRSESETESSYMVDGGVRDVLPILQAIELCENELALRPGKKGILSIGAGVATPTASDVIFAELMPKRFDPEHYRFVDIAATTLEIALDETLSDELRTARSGLPEGVEGLVIAPSFLLGESTDIDPGVVQIGLAYGWMTAWDKKKQLERGFDDETFRILLWLNTNLIAQARYAAWLLEREGTSFYHEHRQLFTHVAQDLLDAAFGLTYTPPGFAGPRDAPTLPAGLVAALDDAIWREIPTGWVFKDEGRVGGTGTSRGGWSGGFFGQIIQQIRARKRDVERFVTNRIREWGLESVPNVHDLSSFGVGNVNCFADWSRQWERHAVQPNSHAPTGPGLVDFDSGRAVPFLRNTTPWDGQHTYHVADLDRRSLGQVIENAWRVAVPRDVASPDYAFLKNSYDVNPRQLSFGSIPPDDTVRRGWFQRDPDYTVVALEGYVFSNPQDGTVPLELLYSSVLEDNYSTTIGGEFATYRHAAGGPLGHIFDPGQQQPSGTVPLLTWRSDSRMDRLTSADFMRFVDGNPVSAGQWNALDVIEPDYAVDRLEGFIFSASDPPPRGTVPLYRWISFSRRDNYTTTRPEWRPDPS